MALTGGDRRRNRFRRMVLADGDQPDLVRVSAGLAGDIVNLPADGSQIGRYVFVILHADQCNVDRVQW